MAYIHITYSWIPAISWYGWIQLYLDIAGIQQYADIAGIQLYLHMARIQGLDFHHSLSFYLNIQTSLAALLHVRYTDNFILHTTKIECYF